MKKIVSAVLLSLALCSCASDDKDLNLPAENLYNKAFDDLEATKYKVAAKEFEQLESDHPYSKWAVKAKLMGAYAYYKDESYDDAIMAADRFLQYHPGNKDAAYAYYLKAMSYYDQISSVDKDQENTRLAEETFRRLIVLYPDSKYAQDAANKIKLAEDYRAGQEMDVGRFYLHNGNYLSALNRFNVVLEEYQTTAQIEEALYRQVEIYGILGMNKYAQGYYKILKMNYPDGQWTAKAADVMEKIGNADIKKENTAQKEETKDEKGWFGWPWFGGDEAAEEAVTASEKTKEETKDEKGWFGWPWFGGDEAVEETVTASEETKEETKDEKGWFGWPWFGGDSE
ncbi:MAG: outer membrane protein assembly factor BamD [Alphaproteobacteria bacterium]|nr:outer membrane protein assembly factor BamD [Alphaproteobacteria bacterium]